MDVSQVPSQLDAAKRQFTDFAIDIETCVSKLDTLCDAAGEQDALMAAIADQVQCMAEWQTRASSAAAALQQVGAEYCAGDADARSAVNFDDVVKAAIQHHYDSNPLKGHYKRTPCWRKWAENLDLDDSEEEDDEIAVTGGKFKNMRCTLTQKSIFDLVEPVEDAHRWVWEKAAILDLISRHHGSCQNPAQPDVFITAAELRPSKRVKRAAAKHRRERETQAATQSTQVL